MSNGNPPKQISEFERRVAIMEQNVEQMNFQFSMQLGTSRRAFDEITRKLGKINDRSFDQEKRLHNIDERFNTTERTLSKYMGQQLAADNTLAAQFKSARYDLRDFGERLTAIEVKFLDRAECDARENPDPSDKNG